MPTPRKTPQFGNIHNAVYTDPRFITLNPLAQLAYIAALGQVDVYGNITADFDRLRAYILPMHALRRPRIEAIFRDFEKAGLAFFYESNGERYVHLQMSNNVRIFPPECPLPPGLTARRPEGKGRHAVYRIYDDAGQECDVEGDPIDHQLRRVAPAFIKRPSNARAVDGQWTSIQYNTEQKQNRTECSVFVPKTETTQQGRAGAGTPPDGVPAAALPETKDAADEDAIHPLFARILTRARQDSAASGTPDSGRL